MKTIVGAYASHTDAMAAVESLKKANYPVSQVSLLTKSDIINKHMQVKASHTAEKAEVGVGVTAGAVVGLLTGIGVFAIPGLGFLYGAGALVGLIAGIDFGIIGAGLTAIFTSIGVDAANSAKYEKYLTEGKFLILAQGSEKQLERAEKILHSHGLHLELERN